MELEIRRNSISLDGKQSSKGARIATATGEAKHRSKATRSKKEAKGAAV
jgi:hypothetical protein